MGIWRVVTGTAHCDRCKKLLAYLEFDANDSEFLEQRTKVWCPDCHEVVKEEREAAKKRREEEMA